MINEDPIIIINHLQVYGKSWNNSEQVIAKSFIRNLLVYSKSFISLCRHYELMIYKPLWSDWSRYRSWQRCYFAACCVFPPCHSFRTSWSHLWIPLNDLGPCAVSVICCMFCVLWTSDIFMLMKSETNAAIPYTPTWHITLTPNERFRSIHLWLRPWHA